MSQGESKLSLCYNPKIQVCVLCAQLTCLNPYVCSIYRPAPHLVGVSCFCSFLEYVAPLPLLPGDVASFPASWLSGQCTDVLHIRFQVCGAVVAAVSSCSQLWREWQTALVAWKGGGVASIGGQSSAHERFAQALGTWASRGHRGAGQCTCATLVRACCCAFADSVLLAHCASAGSEFVLVTSADMEDCPDRPGRWQGCHMQVLRPSAGCTDKRTLLRHRAFGCAAGSDFVLCLFELVLACTCPAYAQCAAAGARGLVATSLCC